MDTPGHDVMLTTSTLTSQCFVFLVFDVTSKASFNKIEDFIENFNNKNVNPNKLLFIVGNKCDKGARQVTQDEGEEYAANYGLKYFETSAQSGKNVDEIFKKAIEQICQNLKDKTYTAGVKLEKFGIQEIKA